MADETLEDAIRESAKGPASMSKDGLSSSEHPLHEQIEVDQYLARKSAATSRALPIRFGKLRPPGTV